LRMIFNLLLMFLILSSFQIVLAEPVQNNFGIVNAWYNGEEATVENVQLKVGEPVEIKVEVTSKIDGHVNVKLVNPLVTESFEVVSGPSIIDERIDNLNIKLGWSETYIWVIRPTGKWTNGNAPINLFIQFTKTHDEYEHIKFTIANPYILDEQYSGPAPTRTATDPSSTNQSQTQGSPGFGVAGALLGIALVMLGRRN